MAEIAVGAEQGIGWQCLLECLQHIRHLMKIKLQHIGGRPFIFWFSQGLKTRDGFNERLLLAKQFFFKIQTMQAEYEEWVFVDFIGQEVDYCCQMFAGYGPIGAAALHGQVFP